MRPNELIANVNLISYKVLKLMEENNKTELVEKIFQLNKELKLLEKSEELRTFVSNVKDLLSAFENNPFDGDMKNKSILRLLSIVSSERSKIIEELGFVENEKKLK